MTTDLKALEAQYQRLGEEIEKLKRQEAEGPKLLKPKPGLKDWYYTTDAGFAVFGKNAQGMNPQLYDGFCSTNGRQTQVFRDAVAVMAELRTQPGIVTPSGIRTCWTVMYNVRQKTLSVDSFTSASFQVVGPAFNTLEYAKAAIEQVGEARIKNAFETLMFMTPESRGEIPN